MSDAPLSTPFLGMGRPMVDRATLEAEGVQPSVIEAIMALVGLAAAMGHAGAKEGDGESYQNVVCRFIDPDWVFYGARPDTPLNPDVIPGLAGGGEITVERDNTLIHAAATILNFSTNFSVVDAGGGQVDIDVTGGGGGGGASNSFETWAVVTSAGAAVASIVADSGTDTATLKEGFAIDIIPNAGADQIQWAFLNGHGLEDDGSGNCRVKAHTYIAVTSSGVAVNLAAVSAYSGASDQYLRNNAGTFQWATLPPDTNTTYTAGAGINLSSTKFIADPHDASHVGLVDPTTGDDSSADDAQIGILWHEIANYDSTKNMLIGHAAGDTTKPVIEYKTVVDWLETLPDWSNSTPLVLISDGGNDGNEIRWATISEMLSLLTGYTLGADQSIGKDAGTGPEWQGDTDECP